MNSCDCCEQFPMYGFDYSGVSMKKENNPFYDYVAPDSNKLI